MTDQPLPAVNRRTKIRQLNDELRASKGVTGMLVVTHAVQALGMEFVHQVVTTVSKFVHVYRMPAFAIGPGLHVDVQRVN